MAANISHTDVICLENAREEYAVPSCPHGPSLLFERFNKSSNQMQKFFACSAFRDRKACNFFKWADSVKELKGQPDREHQNIFEAHENQRKRYSDFKKLPLSDQHICCSCGLLLLPGELLTHQSQGHIIKSKVKLKALDNPSYLFIPLDDNKTYAQYLFSKKTVNFILDALSTRFSHFLCIGTPRIHECIHNSNSVEKRSSFLLDLDQRYGQFFPPEQFAQYNMFNHHFFEKGGHTQLLNFLEAAKDDCVFLIDPPFGGMVEPLALSLSKLSNLCLGKDMDSSIASDTDTETVTRKKECQVPFLLFLPYFMEKRVLSSMEAVIMLDYKVEYDNHDLYKNNVKKKGSPVRMFAHKSMSSLELPTEDGYWWCNVCKKYSAEENLHCKECGRCTSKDGSQYVHCDMCERCVKPSWKHCFTCNMCHVQDHVCQSVKRTGCFICGELDHKKRECPQKNKHIKKRSANRKEETAPGQSKKRKK